MKLLLCNCDSCVHIKPIILPGHVWMESPGPQKKTTSPLTWQNTYFPKHTTMTSCITEAWKTGSHHPLWLHVLLYHNQLVFLCRARRFKDWSYSSLPFLLPAGASNSQSRGSRIFNDPAQLSNPALKEAVIKMTLLHMNNLLLWVVCTSSPS